jgi:5-(carboxyamino)imidazole ribonucleotide synthase
VADRQIQAAYDDRKALTELAQVADVLTYEFENVDAEAVAFLESLGKPLRPDSKALRISQDRLLEKDFLTTHGVQVAPYGEATTEQDLERAAAKIIFPGFLKTVRGGYDGKGQAAVKSLEDAREARASFAPGTRLVLEQRVPFVLEMSVVAARNEAGEIAVYPAVENRHHNNILDVTIAPGRIPPASARQAESLARTIGESLNFVGTFCVEMFLLEDGRVWVNEMAPRPHNSGHWTQDACYCSQFEQQVRAVCGWPLGDPHPHRSAAMINLIGNGEGDTLVGWDTVMADTDAHGHLYGKTKAPKGRKMGHINILADDSESAFQKAEALKALLGWRA